MRKAQAKKLPLAPDGRFNDKLVTRFINNLMWQGKKSTANAGNRKYDSNKGNTLDKTNRN